ncbi:UNVERIFIED_CONTAM: hypothetical protein Slati_4601700 [Sesamum latifolium]|uniref:Uncharacterized protein n=1 Tax=Sesamum latifolium TaxID=2727402 RepID=A0AAW2S1V2_9LAMI
MAESGQSPLALPCTQECITATEDRNADTTLYNSNIIFSYRDQDWLNNKVWMASLKMIFGGSGHQLQIYLQKIFLPLFMIGSFLKTRRVYIPFQNWRKLPENPFFRPLKVHLTIIFCPVIFKPL